MLGFDYFTLLDLLTIARSRRHIEKYYGTTETGRFPERLKPINIKADVDRAGAFPPVISKVPFRPNYVNRSGEMKKTTNLLSHRTNGIPTNEDATEEMRLLFDTDVMSYPKPTGLLKYLVRATTSGNDIVMDFFAGSGTTACGVMLQNIEDGGMRKYILVQLPEAARPGQSRAEDRGRFLRHAS